MLATFLAVMVGWVFFRAGSLGEAWRVLGAMSGFSPGPGGFEYLVTGPTLMLTAAALAVVWLSPNTWHIEFPRSRVAALGLAVLLTACLLHFAAPSPFLYFQF
jgi:alginate O-acetyltransferase complex protein AlgI